MNVKRGTLRLPDYMSNNLKDLLVNLMNWDPEKRFDVRDALAHPFFSPYGSLAKPMHVSRPSEPIVKNPSKVLCEITNGIIRKNTNNKDEGLRHPSVEKKRVTHTKCYSTAQSTQLKSNENVNPPMLHNKILDANLQNRETKSRASIDKFSKYLGSKPDDSHIRKSSDIGPYFNFNARKETTAAPLRAAGANRAITPSMNREGPREVLQGETKIRNHRVNASLQTEISPSYGGPSYSESLTPSQDNTLNSSISLNTTARTQTSPCRGSGIVKMRKQLV